MNEGVAVREGRAWRRLEDFCNDGPRGCGHRYTTGMLLAEEELMALELGDRVANSVVQSAVDGWDALMDLYVREQLRS